MAGSNSQRSCTHRLRLSTCSVICEAGWGGTWSGQRHARHATQYYPRPSKTVDLDFCVQSRLMLGAQSVITYWTLPRWRSFAAIYFLSFCPLAGLWCGTSRV